MHGRVADIAAVAAAEDILGAGLDDAALNAANSQTTNIVVVVQRGEQHLCVAVHVTGGSWDLIDDRLEDGGHVSGAVIAVVGGIAVAGRGKDDRELDLVLVGAQLDEEVDDLVDDLGRTCTRAVNLVDDDDDLLAERQCLFQNETGLRHAALKGIHKEKNTVDHEHDPLDLAAEVGMAGGVDDVDFCTFIHDGRVLGQDGDSALLLEGVGVHDTLVHLLIGAEGTALLEQRIYQRRFTVVNMGDHGDVANVISSFQDVTPSKKLNYQKILNRVYERDFITVSTTMQEIFRLLIKGMIE